MLILQGWCLMSDVSRGWYERYMRSANEQCEEVKALWTELEELKIDHDREKQVREQWRAEVEEWKRTAKTAGELANIRQDEIERLREIEKQFDHLSSEYHLGQDRGDHLVYRHEWEAFDKWQRAGGER